MIAGKFGSYDGTGRNCIARLFGGEVTGIEPVSAPGSLEFYPNPAAEYLIFQDIVGESTVRLYDMLGQLVRSQVLSEPARLDISELRSGTYIIELENQKARRYGRVVII